MNKQQLIVLENYRLKNEITDLRNALSMNRDFLKLLYEQESSQETKINLLYKITLRLTQQSDEALLSNLELIQQKDTLKQEIFKLNQQLDHLQARLQEQIERNNKLDSPSESKLQIQERFKTISNQLLASHQEKIELQQQITYWKSLYQNIEVALRESTQPEEPLLIDQPKMIKQSSQCSTTSIKQPKRRKISRKYTSNVKFMDQEKVENLNREIKHLNQYIEQLQGRLSLFIKAFNYEQNILERKKSSPKPIHPLDERTNNEIQLLKYATNQIKIYERNGDKYMMIRHTFRDNEQRQRERRKVDRSWPKHKDFSMKQKGDFDLYTLRTEEMQA